jgi:hypothetical protein
MEKNACQIITYCKKEYRGREANALLVRSRKDVLRIYSIHCSNPRIDIKHGTRSVDHNSTPISYRLRTVQNWFEKCSSVVPNDCCRDNRDVLTSVRSHYIPMRLLPIESRQHIRGTMGSRGR